MPITATISSESEFPQNGLVLLTAGTPNGWKISIYLDLLGLDYYSLPIDLSSNRQKEEWFTKHNPNGKIPVLLDIKDGKITSLVESVNILIYLGEHYDTKNQYYYSAKEPLYHQQLEILLFQAAGLGPNQGQLHHFGHFFQGTPDPYTLNRFKSETERNYGILNEYLKRNGTGFFVGDKLNVVDINIWPWVHRKNFSKIDLEQYPLVKQWYEKLSEIPEIKQFVV